MALLESGLVKLTCSASRGRECVLHLVRPGALLDVGVLFYEKSLPVSAVGVTAGRLLWLKRASVLSLVERNASFAKALLLAMSLRQRMLINKVAGSQGRIRARARLAAWLMHRARMEKSPVLRFDMTRELLARLLGLSRESLSRQLGRLAADGYIAVRGREVRLLDMRALRALAADG